MKTFISFSTADREVANSFVDELRLFYVDDFFFSPRTLDEGYWLSQIEAEIEAAKWFLVLISPAAMQSKWVRREVELAMAAPHLKGRVVPILIEETEDWTSIHDDIGRLQSAIAQDWRTPAANPKLKPEEVQCQPMKRNPVGPLIKISSMVQSS
jgi:hypothetical protein